MMFLTIVACNYQIDLGDKAGHDTADTDGATGDSGVTDTDPGETGETEDTEETGETPACPPAAGIAGVGTAWDYDVLLSDGYTTDRVVTVTAMEGDTVETTDVITSTGFGESMVSTYVRAFTCDADGMWLVSEAYLYEAVSGGTATTLAHTMLFEPPALQLPHSLEVGTTWDFGHVGTLVFDDESTMAVPEEVFVYEALSATVRPLALGDTPAFEVWVTMRGGSGGWTEYYADGLGFVEGQGWVLASYTP